LPTAAAPRSLKAAWRILRTDDPEWRALGPAIKDAQTRIAERLLDHGGCRGRALDVR
jgi:hypothetical protein